jgi:anaphase-promoting complex subunit 3
MSLPFPEPPELTPELVGALHDRFAALVWSCLDQELPRSAVFYAERYFALNQENHDARHLYSTSLLRAGQTHSALCAVSQPKDQRCHGCEEIRAKCLQTLGRWREAKEALEHSLTSRLHPAAGSYIRSSLFDLTER